MSKAILIVDMPERCDECCFCRGLNTCKIQKYLNRDRVFTTFTVDKQIIDGSKPRWCPLREIPENKGQNGEIRSRIVKPQLMYYGEIKISGMWKRVTSACLTEMGAKRELGKWLKMNFPNRKEITWLDQTGQIVQG